MSASERVRALAALSAPLPIFDQFWADAEKPQPRQSAKSAIKSFFILLGLFELCNFETKLINRTEMTKQSADRFWTIKVMLLGLLTLIGYMSAAVLRNYTMVSFPVVMSASFMAGAMIGVAAAPLIARLTRKPWIALNAAIGTAVRFSFSTLRGPTLRRLTASRRS